MLKSYNWMFKFMIEVHRAPVIYFLFVMFAWVQLDTYQRIQLGAVRNIQVHVEKIIHFDFMQCIHCLGSHWDWRKLPWNLYDSQ